MSCQKGCSIFWCFLFMVSGISLLGIGIWMTVSDSVYDTKIMEDPSLMENNAPWIGSVAGLIAVGIFNFLVGTLGMAGAGCDLDKKVKNSLIAFAIFASIGVISVIIYSSIVTYQFATTDEITVRSDMENNLFFWYTLDEGELNTFEEAWNSYQVEERCCGVSNYTDYEDGAFWNATSSPVPWSCCVLRNEVDPKDAKGKDDVNYDLCIQEANTSVAINMYLHGKGCGEKHWNLLRAYQIILLSVGWTSVLAELVAMFVSGCLRTSAGEAYFV